MHSQPRGCPDSDSDFENKENNQKGMIIIVTNGNYLIVMIIR